MAYQALYRKYRPQTFSQVVGQEHITVTLKNQLAEGKTVHAYLFTGTRGTGKTSCAKILAKAINCTHSQNGDPCLECDICTAITNGENTDIVEIDAASNNSVDSIRDLRDLVNFSPANSKYRVYIIDEVHMLSIGAFNALLKTLEEPPDHVVFILATTEVHKLPATILSRCQRFDFRRIESDKICERLQEISKNEGLTLTNDAAVLIAAAADGGMRDALSILDLCASSNKNIDEQTVEQVCAMAGNDYLVEMCEHIKNRDTEKAIMLIDRLHASSVDMQRLLSELTSHYRDLMIFKTVKSKKKPIVCSNKRAEALANQVSDYDIKDIMFALSVLQSCVLDMQTGNRRAIMEMAVIRLCEPRLSVDIDSLEKRISMIEDALKKGIVPAKIKQSKEAPKEISETIQAESENPPPEAPDSSVAEKNHKTTLNVVAEVESWPQIMTVLSTTCPAIHGVLNGSKAYIKGDYLLIDAPNSMFRSFINKDTGNYKNYIRKAAEEILGRTYKLGPYTPSKVEDQTDELAILAEKLKNLEIN